MFDWSTFLKLADALAACEPTEATCEASWRSGTSRGYYAAYHAVKEYVRDHEPTFTLPRGDTHRELIDFVFRLQAYSREHRQVATSLKRLRERRNEADDERAPNCTRIGAIQHVKDARIILGLVDGLRQKRGMREG